MKLEPVQPGDVVRCAIKGRTGIWGEVTEVKDGILTVGSSNGNFASAG